MKTNHQVFNQMFQNCTLKRNTVEGNGLILIADISGFSKFVQETDVIEGSKITRMLLSSIMDSNMLDLKVSEIEGDAIFFYKYGELPSICSILNQYEVMLQNFNDRLKKIKVYYKKNLELSLKIIVHVGKMTQYTIGKFNKLYGKSIIEAHRLLKNPIPSKSYVLLTEDLIKTVVNHTNDRTCLQANAQMLSESYGPDKTLDFTYYDYQSSTGNQTAINHDCPKAYLQ